MPLWCVLASKPEYMESEYVLQTPLSLIDQVLNPILIQTGVIPVALVVLVLFCA